MVSLAGQEFSAGLIPSERIVLSEVTANSPTITTTETQVQSVTAAVISGHRYIVVWDFGYHVSVTTDHHFARIREDTTSGLALQGRRLSAPTTAQNYGAYLAADYVADASENKVFSGTLVRTSGTGNVSLAGAATTPSRMAVYLVS